MNLRRIRRDERGQTLVIVALGMVALVAMVGVVVDVGLQWGANRKTQNGTDATAHAGTVVIMDYLAGDTTLTDADVETKVDAMAAETGIQLESAEYVAYQPDVNGDLQPVSLGIDVGYGGGIPATAQGVAVIASQTHETFLARVVGIKELSVTTDAIAVTGPVPTPCQEGQPCPLLPVTFPNTVVTCDGQNKGLTTDDGWDLDHELIVPLCGNFAGGVGWIDWTPPSGGDSELAAEICNPDTSIALPDWFFVTATGNTNSDPVQTCFENWLNKPILIPLFDDVCKIDPLENNPCPDGEVPTGQQSWYHFPTYASFYLTGVYIKGNHADVCDTGNGATTCFTGHFVDTSGTGTVGQYVPPDPDNPPISEFFAVQLIR